MFIIINMDVLRLSIKYCIIVFIFFTDAAFGSTLQISMIMQLSFGRCTEIK